MVRRAFAQTFMVIKSPNSGTKTRFFCMFGTKRRFVFRLEWETWLPVTGLFPVSWQILDMSWCITNLVPSDFGRTRTFNLLIRSQVLYPIKLRSLIKSFSNPFPPNSRFQVRLPVSSRNSIIDNFRIDQFPWSMSIVDFVLPVLCSLMRLSKSCVMPV